MNRHDVKIAASEIVVRLIQDAIQTGAWKPLQGTHSNEENVRIENDLRDIADSNSRRAERIRNRI